MAGHLARAIPGRLQKRFVDKPHQRHVQQGLAGLLIVEGRSADRDQGALPQDRDLRVVGVDHRSPRSCPRTLRTARRSPVCARPRSSSGGRRASSPAATGSAPLQRLQRHFGFEISRIPLQLPSHKVRPSKRSNLPWPTVRISGATSRSLFDADPQIDHPQALPQIFNGKKWSSRLLGPVLNCRIPKRGAE